jgi:hypothetical protein
VSSRRLVGGTALTGPAGDALATATVSRRVDLDGDGDDFWIVRINDQLDRRSWEQVAAVMDRIAGGGRYQKGAQVHRFSSDPTVELAAVVDMGALPAHPQQREGWVGTPDGVADNLIVNYAFNSMDNIPHSRPFQVLEPSAGEGALADATVKFYVEAEQITCVEPDPQRAAICRAKGYRTETARLEEWALRQQQRWDIVIMNPPFSLPDDPLAWATHVLLAWSLVDVGGLLTAILPKSSYESQQARRAQDVRDLVGRYGICWDHFDNFHFDKDAFAESGWRGTPTIIHIVRPPGEEPLTPRGPGGPPLLRLGRPRRLRRVPT